MKAWSDGTIDPNSARAGAVSASGVLFFLSRLSAHRISEKGDLGDSYPFGAGGGGSAVVLVVVRYSCGSDMLLCVFLLLL